MRKTFKSTLLGFGVAPAFAAPVLAQGTTSGPAPGTDIVLELGADGRVSPEYPGADSYILSPMPIVKLHFLVLPIFGTVTDSSQKSAGISFYPAFNYVGGRNADDHAELSGLRDVNWAAACATRPSGWKPMRKSATASTVITGSSTRSVSMRSPIRATG